MKIKERIKYVKWKETMAFFIIACGLTYLFVQMPNIIKEVWSSLFNLTPNFSWNHGIALFIVGLAVYRFSKVERKTTFFGSKPYNSIGFSAVFLIAYSIVGFSNSFGINPHLWALIFCVSTLIYDFFEESAWRGFLNDSLIPFPSWMKGIITGILWSTWHLLIFKSFEHFGGFHIFLILSIIVSILMSYATERTNSVLVASSIHALLILRDLNVTIICAVIWTGMLTFWNFPLYNGIFNTTTKQKS
jgi:hypothetical protein